MDENETVIAPEVAEAPVAEVAEEAPVVEDVLPAQE